MYSNTLFFHDPTPTEIYTLSLHDALPIWHGRQVELVHHLGQHPLPIRARAHFVGRHRFFGKVRSEEHTSELQSLRHLVCRLLLEKKKIRIYSILENMHRDTHHIVSI